MRAGLRPMAVDGPLAVLIGLVVAGSTRAASHQSRGNGGFGPRRDGPFGGSGPPWTASADPAVLGWLVAPALVLIVAGVALRRVRPRIGYAAAVAGTAAFLLAGGPGGPVLAAPALAVYSLSAAVPVRRWLPWMLALPVMITAGFWRQPYGGLLNPGLYAALVFGTAAIVSPALLGLLRRVRRETDARERELDRRRSAYEERLRIAREVHDVVGHSLSVIHMQAGVALHVLDRRPEQVETSLDAIRRTSSDALAELRGTLALFRAEPPDAQPGLGRLDGLVSALHAAGRTVTVEREDLPSTLPTAVDHAAYRIVQEALTNVVRHGGEAAATVTVGADGARLRVEVTSGGPVIAPADLAAGSGIAGMHERAAAVGGQVSVTPRPGGGVSVVAELPLAAPRVSEPAP